MSRLWTVGLGTWAAIFWNLRRRSGPITFVERQIAHVWAGSMIVDTFMYAIEYQLDLPVLTLSPMLGPVERRGLSHESGRCCPVCFTSTPPCCASPAW